MELCGRSSFIRYQLPRTYRRFRSVARPLKLEAMTSKHRIFVTLTAGITAIVALALLIERGGLIAWLGVFIGVALLAKAWLKPGRRDLAISIALALLLVVAWFGSRYYVISTWESGEVVELVIPTNAGPHTARLWVLDIGEYPVVYYDAEPEVAAALLAGTPIQLTRKGEVSTRIPQTRLVDTLPEAEANEVLAGMETKYGERNNAAVVYYLMLGRSRDRIAVVASLASVAGSGSVLSDPHNGG